MDNFDFFKCLEEMKNKANVINESQVQLKVFNLSNKDLFKQDDISKQAIFNDENDELQAYYESNYKYHKMNNTISKHKIIKTQKNTKIFNPEIKHKYSDKIKISQIQKIGNLLYNENKKTLTHMKSHKKHKSINLVDSKMNNSPVAEMM